MRQLLMLCSLLAMAPPAIAAEPMAADRDDLLAQWKFDEGQGTVAKDSSGHNHHAKIHRAKWTKQGDGFALMFDGIDEALDCGDTAKLGIAGPVCIELWLKPMRKAHGEAFLAGEGHQTFGLLYYNTERATWYIGGGGNGTHGQLNLGQWNHIVASFDGKTMNVWVNGRLANTKESLVKEYKAAGKFAISSPGHPELPKFKGMIDNVRIYNRALTGDEVDSHFKTEAAQYDFNPVWFSRPKTAPFYYFDRGEIVIEANYKQLLPLVGAGRVEVSLTGKLQPQQVLAQQTVEQLPATGSVEVKLSCPKLADGDYLLRVTLTDDKGQRPTEEIPFSYPPRAPDLPSPADATVAMPKAAAPPASPLRLSVSKGGGFAIDFAKTRYRFESRISWPNGDFNTLSAADKPAPAGEKSWKVRTRAAGKNRFEVDAGGSFYTVHREIEAFPDHVQVKDTYTNTTDQDLGLLIYNEMPVRPNQLTQSLLSGREKFGKQEELSYPVYCPTLFVADASAGLGIVPIDDVFIVQSAAYTEEKAAGICTERFALPPKKSYTLEWAIYPVESRDYYDFLNNYRTAEGRIGKADGSISFVTYGPHPPLSHQPPDKNFFEMRNLKIGIIHCLAEIADDPTLECEGFEVTEYPKELKLMKDQVSAIHALRPGSKITYHIAHSLYTTNKPEQFTDSRVIAADGTHVTWGDGSAFGPQKQAEGWRWWCFYPTPGNSYHKMMMERIDVLMNDVGLDGAFFDGFLAGYGSQWTYDRWDEHTAEIDRSTKTITRKVGSVALLSQPSMIEIARKIHQRGGVVIANHAVVTRSLAKENYIIFDNECASGPDFHSAPSITALGATNLNTERDVYLDTLDKLRYGTLFIGYGESYGAFAGRTYRSLQAYQYPMTFEEIRAGLVRGKERIVTMNDGVYSWPGSTNLHFVRKFDARGMQVPHDFTTSIDSAGVRTQLKIGENESAVIEPIQAEINSPLVVNARVLASGPDELQLLVSGQGAAELRFKPWKAGAAYRATVDGKPTTIADSDGVSSLPLKLTGLSRISITQ